MIETTQLEKCNECGNPSFEWVDFTAKSVYECEQCKTKFYLEI